MALTQTDLQTAWLVGQVGVLQSQMGELNLSSKRTSATLNDNERLTISNTLLLLENSQLRAKLLQTFKRSSVSRVGKESSADWETVKDLDSEELEMDLDVTIVDEAECNSELSQTDLVSAWFQADSMIRATSSTVEVRLDAGLKSTTQYSIPTASCRDLCQMDLALAWFQADAIIRAAKLEEMKFETLSQKLEDRLINVINRLESLPGKMGTLLDIDNINQRLESVVNRLESSTLSGFSNTLESRLVNVIERIESIPGSNMIGHSSKDLNDSFGNSKVAECVLKRLSTINASTQTEQEQPSPSTTVEVIKPSVEQAYVPQTVTLQPFIDEAYTSRVIVLENISEPEERVRKLSVETLPAINEILSVQETYLPSPVIDNFALQEVGAEEVEVPGRVVVVNPLNENEYYPEVVVLSGQAVEDERYIPTVVVLETKSENQTQDILRNDYILFEDKIKINVTKIGQKARKILFDSQNALQLDTSYDLESACLYIITSLLQWALRGGREREGYMVTYENESYYLQSNVSKAEQDRELESERQQLEDLKKEMEEKLKVMEQQMERERTAFEDLIMMQIQNRRRNMNGNVQ